MTTLTILACTAWAETALIWLHQHTRKCKRSSARGRK
jgi:hypothetical protein